MGSWEGLGPPSSLRHLAVFSHTPIFCSLCLSASSVFPACGADPALSSPFYPSLPLFQPDQVHLIPLSLSLSLAGIEDPTDMASFSILMDSQCPWIQLPATQCLRFQPKILRVILLVIGSAGSLFNTRGEGRGSTHATLKLSMCHRQRLP